MPTAGGSTPAEWIKLTGQLVDPGTVSADLNGFSAVALRWRHEPDAAVAVLEVVPIHERRDPSAGLLDTLEWPSGVVRPVLTAPRDCVYKVWNSDSE
jgi:hypothetical protein